jgi:hypothetical protein
MSLFGEEEEISAAVNAVAVVDAAAPLFGDSGSAASASVGETKVAVNAVDVVRAAAPLFGGSGTTTSFAHRSGFLSSGNDIHAGLMTVVQAKDWATAHLNCAGFTYAEGDPEPSAPIQIYFKSVASFSPGSGWSSYLVTHPATAAQAPAPTVAVAPTYTPQSGLKNVPLPSKVQSLASFCAKPVEEAGLFDELINEGKDNKEAAAGGGTDVMAELFASAKASSRQGKLFSAVDDTTEEDSNIDDLFVGQVLQREEGAGALFEPSLKDTLYKAAEAGVAPNSGAPARTAADAETDKLLNDGLLTTAGDQLFSRFEDATAVRNGGAPPAESAEAFTDIAVPQQAPPPVESAKPSVSAAQASAGTLDFDSYIASQGSSSGGGLFD